MVGITLFLSREIHIEQKANKQLCRLIYASIWIKEVYNITQRGQMENKPLEVEDFQQHV
jgi:hypothetical protein